MRVVAAWRSPDSGLNHNLREHPTTARSPAEAHTNDGVFCPNPFFRNGQARLARDIQKEERLSGEGGAATRGSPSLCAAQDASARARRLGA